MGPHSGEATMGKVIVTALVDFGATGLLLPKRLIG